MEGSLRLQVEKQTSGFQKYGENLWILFMSTTHVSITMYNQELTTL